jgi:hypothetical protein
MKKSKSYLPKSQSEKAVWLNTFSSKIGTHATVLGLTAAEVTNIQKDAAFFSYVDALLEDYREQLKAMISYKDELCENESQAISPLPVMPALGAAPAITAKGIFKRISDLVTRIRHSAGYSETIGHELGIIGEHSEIEVSTMQPELKISLELGQPRIRCAKKITDGIDLFVNRNDGAGFVFLKRVVKPDYIDEAELPVSFTEWSYKAIFFIGNVNVGMMSQIKSVVVRGS